MPVIVKLGGGNCSLKEIAKAIGEPATEKDKKERLSEIIDSAQTDIANLCNERGCQIPSNPTFPQILSGISRITHFTKPNQVSKLKAVGNHDTANQIDLSWKNPTGDKNFSGVKLLYKTESYPTSPTDGVVAYDGQEERILLTNMSHGVRYYFRAFAYSRVDGGFVYNELTTGAECIGISSLNSSSQVEGLTATVGHTTSGYVKLTWKNPSDSKFKGVKILYKTGEYPTSPADGIMVYDGQGTSVEKIGLVDGMTYYFRAFAYNLNDGIYSYNISATGAECTGAPFINKGQVIFTSSQNWTVPTGVSNIDVFLVGGGGGGELKIENINGSGGTGGGGGYTKTIKNVNVTPLQSIPITIGAGGAGLPRFSKQSATIGGTTEVLGYQAIGGNQQNPDGESVSFKGMGCGGSGAGGRSYDSYYYGGIGGTDGSNGYFATDSLTPSYYPLITDDYKQNRGQKTTTRAFGENENALYAGGGAGNMYTPHGEAKYLEDTPIPGGAGGGGCSNYKGNNGNGGNGTPNTGGGGGGSIRGFASGSGGSGIAIIRWGY